MVGGIVTIMCYWSGKMITCSKGLAYEGATPKVLRVNSRIKFDELMEKIFVLTGFDKEKFEIKITCRYPCNSNEYIPLAVEDHETLDAVFDVAKQPGVNCLEWYLEAIPACNNKSSTVETFTQLLTQENVSEHLESHIQIPRPKSHLMNEGVSQAAFSTDLIKEIVASEAENFAFNGDICNNLLSDDDEAIREEEEVEAEGFMVYEEPPAPEFTNIESTNNGSVDFSVTNENFNEQAREDLYAGQKFGTKKELQKAVKTFSIKYHQEFEVSYSTPSLWILKCKKAPQCSWRLRACVPKGASYFEIRKYGGPHTCVNPILSRDHAQLDCGFIADQVKALIKSQISISLVAIQAEIFDRFGYNISPKKAWNAKQKAIVELFGDWVESYKVLPRYMDVLKHTNPGTIVHWDKVPVCSNPPQEVFHRVFWAFDASIKGFEHCRPVLSVDGTHLYGKYKGVMLIAVSSDGNNQLFPLAFSIVEGENIDSWIWFMSCIRKFVTQRRGLCVISDRHAGVLAAMSTIGLEWNEPFAFHRFCIRHLASNFNKKFRDKTLKNLVTLAASENQVCKFQKKMETIGKINAEARKWLEELPVEKWTLSHDGGRRYGIMTTNLSEVFNGVLKGARSLPITALVQLTFYRVNSYFATRRQLGIERTKSGHLFTPFADGKIISNGIKAGGHEVVLFNRTTGTFSIKTNQSVANRGNGGRVHIVKLHENSCTCQKWQIFGFPCSHVMASCQYSNIDYKRMVQHWYSISTYERTWSAQFHPIPDKAYWPPENEVTLLPNESMKRSSKGRPKSTRLHNEMDAKEGEAKGSCSLCKQKGHNKRRCPVIKR